MDLTKDSHLTGHSTDACATAKKRPALTAVAEKYTVDIRPSDHGSRFGGNAGHDCIAVCHDRPRPAAMVSASLAWRGGMIIQYFLAQKMSEAAPNMTHQHPHDRLQDC